MIFGKRLKQIRIERGLQQEDVAEILNLHRATISRYENNQREPDINTLINIAKHFDISIDWLLGITDRKVSVNNLNSQVNNFTDLYEIYSSLSSEKQALLRAFAKLLAEQDLYT